MYFESAFYRVNHLSTMENEKLKEFLKKAADKCNTAPESFYIYPTCITDEKVFLVMRTSFNQMGRVGDFIENCGINMNKNEISEISPEYFEGVSDGIGLDYYRELYAGYPEEVKETEIEFYPIPSKDWELTMPNNAEHPLSLIKELVSIDSSEKPITANWPISPINYYVVSHTKGRQRATTMALLNSLLINKWVPSSYYKTISLGLKDGKYNPAMKHLDYFYKGESDYPIVLSINGDKTMLKGDETLNAFADTMVRYNRKNLTIIESNFFDEKMMKAIEEKDPSIPFVVIIDTEKMKAPHSILPKNTFKTSKECLEVYGEALYKT